MDDKLTYMHQDIQAYEFYQSASKLSPLTKVALQTNLSPFLSQEDKGHAKMEKSQKLRA